MYNNFFNIIICTKDDHKNFNDTLESVELQNNFSNFKIIIVDSSKTYQNKYLKKSISKFNLEYYWIKPQGIYNAYNFALSKTNKGWVIFLNSGDLFINSNCLYEINRILNKKCVYSFNVFIGESLESKKIRKSRKFNIFTALLGYMPPNTGLVFPQQILNQNNFNENFKISSDYHNQLNLLIKKNIKFISLDSIFIFMNNNGVSNTNINTSFIEDYKILIHYFNLYGLIVLFLKKIRVFLWKII